MCKLKPADWMTYAEKNTPKKDFELTENDKRLLRKHTKLIEKLKSNPEK